MNRNVYLSNNSSAKLLNKHAPIKQKPPFEFESENRIRIASDVKERFGVSHGGTKKKRKK